MFHSTTIALLLAAATLHAMPVRAAMAEPSPSIGATSAAVDRGARQIVANHPIVPVPAAVWPAMLGIAFVARRAIAVANRAR